MPLGSSELTILAVIFCFIPQAPPRAHTATGRQEMVICWCRQFLSSTIYQGPRNSDLNNSSVDPCRSALLWSRCTLRISLTGLVKAPWATEFQQSDFTSPHSSKVHLQISLKGLVKAPGVVRFQHSDLTSPHSLLKSDVAFIQLAEWPLRQPNSFLICWPWISTERRPFAQNPLVRKTSEVPQCWFFTFATGGQLTRLCPCTSNLRISEGNSTNLH